MAHGFFSNAIVYIKLDWLIIIEQCIGYAYVIFLGVWICIFKKYFLTQHKMVLSSVISLNEMKSLVITKRKTHQEISNILKERHPVMRGVSAMNVRRFCNKNGKRIRTTLDDSEIEKKVKKSIAEVINELLQNIVRKNAVLFLKVFTNLSFIPPKQVSDKNFTPYLLSLSCVKVGGNYETK